MEEKRKAGPRRTRGGNIRCPLNMAIEPDSLCLVTEVTLSLANIP